MIQFNGNSNDHVSALLFGGTLMDNVIEPVLDDRGCPVLFKTGLRKGEVKTHKVSYSVRIKGVYSFFDTSEIKTKKEGVYQTNEQVLLKVQQLATEDNRKLIDVILEKRRLNKLISTYYEGIKELIYNDGCVRPNFQHTSTDTGRLSCNAPNVQNIPR